jgi:AmmeMemoRadiSam system protein B
MRWVVVALVAASPFPDLSTCDASSTPYDVVTGFMTNAASITPTQVESHHIIAVVPRSAAFDTGEAEVSALAYAALPRVAVDGGTGFDVAYTRVVLITAEEGLDTEGIFFPPCGGMRDDDAVDWLKEAATSTVNGASLLQDNPTSTLQYQAPFAEILLGPRKEKHLLPIVLGKQTPQLAQQVGDLLARLVTSDGPYTAERVLFVFAGDLSHNLEKQWATPRDQETVKRMTAEGFSALITYFGDMKKASAAGESRQPVDSAVVLGAVKLAENLNLRGAAIRVANSGCYIGELDRNDLDKVRGYASVLFLRDDRTAGEIASSQPAKPEVQADTTTTTSAPTTMVPPPTLEPAPFGAQPPPVLMHVHSQRSFMRAAMRAEERREREPESEPRRERQWHQWHRRLMHFSNEGARLLR